MTRPSKCYLCGQPVGADATADHVPPQQFFAPAIRRRVNLDKLVTLPTHAGCNSGFARDEEYAVNAIEPVAYESPAGDALIQHRAARFRAGRAVGLGHRILRSFEARPSGLVLPRGLVAVRLDGERVKRVVWKIVRGLYFLEYGTALDERTRFYVELKEPENRDPSELDRLWNVVLTQPSRGPYQAVFAHKHLLVERGDTALYLWAMLWWDRVIVFVSHVRSGDAADD